jgi:hypothetical protein
MTSGSAAGAAKSVTTLALEAPRNDWLRAGDFHDVQGSRSPAHQQDEYTLAAESRLRSENIRSCYLHRESIHALLGGGQDSSAN